MRNRGFKEGSVNQEELTMIRSSGPGHTRVYIYIFQLLGWSDVCYLNIHGSINAVPPSPVPTHVHILDSETQKCDII
jgi:hypothetical protein